MIVGLDTSVVVRLLTGMPVEQANSARAALEAQPYGSVAVSDLVVGETYFALRHHYGVPHGRTIAALRAFLFDSRIRATGVAKLARQDWRFSGAVYRRPAIRSFAAADHCRA